MSEEQGDPESYLRRKMGLPRDAQEAQRFAEIDRVEKECDELADSAFEDSEDTIRRRLGLPRRGVPTDET